MKPICYRFDIEDTFADTFTAATAAEKGHYELRQFPDGETYLRIQDDCQGRDCILLANLHRPDAKFLALAYLAATLKDIGARRVILVAPYLPYMRQDIRFNAGEGITSRYFAGLLSNLVDGLVTVDPHLHRYATLDEIYSIPSKVLHAEHTLAAWIRDQIPKPLIVGPDSESEQWAQRVAHLVGCEALVLKKTRLGDRDVHIEIPEVSRFQGHTPVLVDDIISTGRTMLETAEHLVSGGLTKPVCVGIHAVFSEDAFIAMNNGPIARVVTCNSIPHISNGIHLEQLLADGLSDFLREIQLA